MVAAAVIVCSLPWLATHQRNDTRDSDVRPIVSYLTDPVTARGAILVAPAFMRICVDYYARDRGGLPLTPIAVGDDLTARLRDGRANG